MKEIIEEEKTETSTEEPAKTEAKEVQQNLTGNFGNTPLAR